jgi:hypothetical protein
VSAVLELPSRKTTVLCNPEECHTYLLRSANIIRTYNTRWNDPNVQGKTVALDATLLTTRFFYTATPEEPLETKRIVIGWHRYVQIQNRISYMS